jgi:hypothetical protein
MLAGRYTQLGAIVVAVGLAIQVARPARTNPPTDPARAVGAHVAIPPAVQTTLRRACYDCHSNETRWPWYSSVAPVSWFVIGHVNDGRRRLNFSEWDAHDRRTPTPPFGRICQEVSGGGMPLSSYLLLHDDARLTPADVSQLCAWANQVAASPGGSPRPPRT